MSPHDKTTELCADDARTLLAIARNAVQSAVRSGVTAFVDTETLSPALRAPSASFVTLTQHGNLRGCIGSLQAHRPLAEDVAANALASALHDPRFPPVSLRELPDIHVEVSVLSPPVDFPVRDETDLLHKLQPGVHGLIISDGAYRATFLPAVWEQLPDARQFLAHLKQKAGLPVDYWSPGLRFQVYTAQKIR